MMITLISKTNKNGWKQLNKVSSDEKKKNKLNHAQDMEVLNFITSIISNLH